MSKGCSFTLLFLWKPRLNPHNAILRVGVTLPALALQKRHFSKTQVGQWGHEVQYNLLSWQKSWRSRFKVYKLVSVLQMEIPCNYQALLQIGDDSKNIALWDLSHTVLLLKKKKKLRQGTQVFSLAKPLGISKGQGGNVGAEDKLVINWFGMLGWKVGTWVSLLSEILVFVTLLATYIFCIFILTNDFTQCFLIPGYPLRVILRCSTSCHSIYQLDWRTCEAQRPHFHSSELWEWLLWSV